MTAFVDIDEAARLRGAGPPRSVVAPVDAACVESGRTADPPWVGLSGHPLDPHSIVAGASSSPTVGCGWTHAPIKAAAVGSVGVVGATRELPLPLDARARDGARPRSLVDAVEAVPLALVRGAVARDVPRGVVLFSASPLALRDGGGRWVGTGGETSRDPGCVGGSGIAAAAVTLEGGTESLSSVSELGDARERQEGDVSREAAAPASSAVRDRASEGSRLAAPASEATGDSTNGGEASRQPSPPRVGEGGMWGDMGEGSGAAACGDLQLSISPSAAAAGATDGWRDGAVYAAVDEALEEGTLPRDAAAAAARAAYPTEGLLLVDGGPVGRPASPADPTSEARAAARPMLRA